MELFVVHTCDQWKGYDSFRFKGVFTSRRALNKCLNTLIKEKEIEVDEDAGYELPLTDWTLQDIDNGLTYVSVQAVTANEMQ